MYICVTGIPETNNGKNMFLTRFKNWRHWTLRWPYHGKYVRLICIFGVADLPRLSRRPELFANKLHADFQPATLDCIEEWHHTRTRAELSTGETAPLNVTFYAQMDYVQHHVTSE